MQHISSLSLFVAICELCSQIKTTHISKGIIFIIDSTSRTSNLNKFIKKTVKLNPTLSNQKNPHIKIEQNH
ncbi:hypothetical protein HanIR_Chr07g0332741 [Helianthus annuus]|nr:hypothetical protein HanIR_Chr07g0332741 [Helianthus annuus]